MEILPLPVRFSALRSAFRLPKPCDEQSADLLVLSAAGGSLPARPGPAARCLDTGRPRLDLQVDDGDGRCVFIRSLQVSYAARVQSTPKPTPAETSPQIREVSP